MNPVKKKVHFAFIYLHFAFILPNFDSSPTFFSLALRKSVILGVNVKNT